MATDTVRKIDEPALASRGGPGRQKASLVRARKTEVRKEKVRLLKELVEKNAYQIDLRKVAQKLLVRLLLERDHHLRDF